MTSERNAYGQPVGYALPDWTRRRLPDGVGLIGRYCRLEKLDAERHATELYAAFAETPDGRDWTYLSVGPFADVAAYREYVRQATQGTDPVHYAIIDGAANKPVGSSALMRIDPDNGTMEIGWVSFSSLLKRSRVATEAMYLLMRHAFDDLGYRRYEWKCDSLNAPSRRAAERLGFRYEGTFRNAMVYKGRTRDTDWFSITDSEWPAVRKALEAWLAPENFDGEGKQRQSLSALQAGGLPAN
jgi:RimJ/RimL family protein N-acetyltransferase